MLGAVPCALAMRLRMDLGAKSGEEKTGKQTAEAENDVPETMATSSCLPGKSKNNKIQGDEESNETTQGGGGLVPRCSDAHQARKQLMPVRLCACLSVCPTPRNEEAKIILCTQAKRRDELWMLPPYTLVVLVVVCPLSLGLVNMAPNCRLNFSPMDACVFVCVLV